MALITTTRGEQDENLFIKREGIEDEETQIVHWIEYWDGMELVHRSVHITKKGGIGSTSAAQLLG